MIPARRRALTLGLLLLAAGCAEPASTRTVFPPLRFDYLLKLQLNVASVEEAPPPPAGPLDLLDPAPPIDALFQMARDRLLAGGSRGKAVFVIEQADLSRILNGLEGVLAVRLDIVGPDGGRAGFAQARVTRRATGVDELRAGLYDLTQQMMQDMNVELEFQVRRSLAAWLQEAGAAPAPAAVEQQPLSPAPAPRSDAAPAGGGSSGSASAARSRP